MTLGGPCLTAFGEFGPSDVDFFGIFFDVFFFFPQKDAKNRRTGTEKIPRSEGTQPHLFVAKKKLRHESNVKRSKTTTFLRGQAVELCVV